jgi:tape measure domain-containing protein
MSTDLGTLLLKIGVSDTEYWERLSKIKAQTISVGQELEKALNVSVKSDEKSLDSLNRHLDKKVAHVKQVQNFFNTHPLTPKVDDRALKALNKQLDAVQQKAAQTQRSIAQAGTGIAQGRSPASPVQGGGDGADRIVKELIGLRKDLVKAIADQSKQSAASKVGQAAAAPVRAVGSVLGTVATGSLEKLGRDLSGSLSEGLSTGLKKELSFTVGSLDYVGEEIGKALLSSITKELGQTANAIENIFSDLIGNANIDREGAAVRGAAARQRSDRRSVAQEQAAKEFNFVRENLGAIRELGIYKGPDAEVLRQKIEKETERIGGKAIKESIEGLTKQLDSISAQIANPDTDSAQSISLSNLAKQLIQRRQSLYDRLGIINKAAEQSFQAEIEELEKAEREFGANIRLQGRLSRAVDNAERLQSTESSIAVPRARPPRIGNPDAFNQIAAQVAERSNVSLPSNRIPNLVSSNNIRQGVFAQYVPEGNKIEVPPELYEAIKAGELTAKATETLVHELRHAVQLNFGDRKISDSSAVPLIDPTFEESRRLGRRIEGSVGAASDSKVRSLESDAYVFADRFAAEIAESISRQAKAGKFIEQVGTGGGRIERQVYSARNTAAKFVIGQRGQGIGSDDDLNAALDAIDKITKGFSEDIESLVNIDLLPTSEIESAATELNSRMRQSIDALKNLATNYGKVPLDLSQKAEAEAELILARNPINQKRLQAEQSRTGSNSFAARAKARINKQVYSEDAIEQASQKIVASQADIEDAIAQAQNLANKFVGLYQYFKEVVQTEDLDKVEALQADIVRYAKDAQASIDNAIAQAKSLDLPDNDLVNRLGAQKGQIGRKVSLSSQAAIKLRNRLGDEDPEALLAVEDIAENVRDYLEKVNKKIKERLNPDLVQQAVQLSADVDVRQAQRDLNIDRAEVRANQKAERVSQDIEKKLARLSEGDSIGDRVNRIIKAEVGDVNFVELLNSKVGNLLNTIGSISAITVGLSLFGAFADESVKAAAALEQLEVKLKFVVGSTEAATSAIEAVRDRSNDLGTNFNADIAGFAQLQAASKGTPLQGAGVTELAESFQGASAIYQLNAEQQERAYTALEQILSKGKVSTEEIRGQLSEALPGSFQIAARAMGVTTQELDKLLQAGEIVSSEFLPKFARQLAAENFTGLGDASDTYSASLNRLSNTFGELKQKFGAGLLPAKQLGLDVAQRLLEGVAANMEALAIAASALGTVMTVQLLKSLIAVIVQLKIMPAVMAIAKAGFAGVAAAMGPTLLAMAALTAAASGVMVAMQIMGESSGEAGRLAAQSSGGFEALKNRLDGVKASAEGANKAIQAEGIIGKLFGGTTPKNEADRPKLPGLDVDNPINRFLNYDISAAIVRRQVRGQVQGRTEAAQAATDQANERLSTIGNIINGQGLGARELATYNQIEQALKQVRIEQQAVSAIAPENIDLLQALKDREAALLEQQGQVAPTINQSSSEIEKELERQKAILAALEADFESGRINDISVFEMDTGKIKANIANLTRLQDQFNQSIDDGSRAYTEFARRSEDIRAIASDQNLQITQDESAARAELLRTQGLTSAQRQSGLSSIAETRVSAQLQANQNAIAALQAQLQSSEISGVLGSLGINSASSIGPAQLQLLQSRAGESVEIQTAVGLLENLRELEAQAGQLGEESAQIVSDINQQMSETDKAMREYFRELENQTASIEIDTKRSQANLSLAEARRDINRAVTGVTGSFISGFSDLLLDLIEAFNEPLNAALDAQSSLLEAQQRQFAALAQNEMQRAGLPGGYGGVTLDAGGANGFVDAAKATSVVNAAGSWVGREFNEGVQAQCAYFVRAAFKQAGIDLGVSADRTSSGDPRAGQLGAGFASSLIGSDIGTVRRTRDPNSIPSGAIVGFTNTYGNFEQGAITHVGVSTGGGQMVDRSTSARPVSARPITTFSPDRNGEYIYVVPRQIAASVIPPQSAALPTGARPAARSQSTAQQNLDRFFDAVSFLEANNNPQNFNRDRNGNIYASGAFQFTPITRTDAAELGLKDPGDRSLTYEEQRRRAQEFARVRDPRGYAAAAAGDWREAERQFRNRWTSLPGAAEATQSSDRYDRYYSMLSGGAGAAGGVSIAGASANNQARLASDNAIASLYGGQLDNAQSQIYGNFNAETANIQRDYQARLAQAELQREAALQNLLTLSGEAKKQMEELYQQGNRQFQDLILESLPDNVDTQVQEELQEIFRRREDDTRALLDEFDQYQATMTNARQVADQTRALQANGQYSPDQIADLQRVIEEAGQRYTQAQENIVNVRDRLAEIDHVYDDILAEVIEGQTREGQTRAFEFRQQTEGLAAEFAREVEIRQANLRGEGFDALNIDADLQRAEIELNYDTQIRELEELGRTGQRTAQQVEELKLAYESVARAQLEGVTRETERLADELRRMPTERLFELRNQLQDARAANASQYGIGEFGQRTGAAEASAIAIQENAFANEIEEFRAMAEEAGLAQLEIARVEEAMRSLNEQKLDTIRDQFNEWTPAINVARDSTEGLFNSLFDRTKTIGESFRGFFDSILQGFAQIASKRITDSIFGGLLQTDGGEARTRGGAGAGVGGFLNTILGGVAKVFGFADGGKVPYAGRAFDSYRRGYGAISAALAKEGPNSILAALTPGERVLTQQESNTYTQYRNLFNFAAGGLVPGAFNAVRSPGMAFSINLGGVNTVVNGAASGMIDPLGFQQAFEREAPRIVQNEINRQQGLGGTLEKGI